MSLIWVLLAFLVIYLFYGALVQTPYRRVFSGGFDTDEVKHGFLCPQEVFDPDEKDLAARISESFSNDSLRRKKFAARDDEMYHEPHWGHTSALVHGTLRIENIDNLPGPFRVGLFANNATYPVVARSGVVKDPDLGFAINRLAVKLKYPEPVPNMYAPSGEAEELDLLFVAGEPRNNGAGHTFFARDARQLDMATTLKPPSLQTLKTFSNWRNIRLLTGILGTVKALMKPLRQPPSSNSGWAGKPYFSLGPFALGQGAMKYNLTPLQAHPVADTDPMKADVARVNKDNMTAWLNAGEDARFTLGIQLATPECIPDPGPNDPPKSVMAAEFCDLQWDEDRSPYIPVGTLTLAAEADAAVNVPSVWGSLQFNAWNTLPSMQPIGQLFRIRKHVHSAHSQVRVSHLHGGIPGELTGKCPFSD